MKCYNYGQLGHHACRCPEKSSSSNHDKRVAYAQEDSFKENEVDHIESEKGENLMFIWILIKQPALDEPKHRRALFRVRCKILGIFFKVVVDLGSTNNIILEEEI